MVALMKLAELVGGELKGPGDSSNLEITGTSSVDGFSPGRICYARSARYLSGLDRKTDPVVVIPRELSDHGFGPGATLLIVEDAVEAFIEIQNFFYGQRTAGEKGISSSAEVDPSAQVHESASIAAGASVAAGVVVGADAVIGHNVTLLDGVRIGKATVLKPSVVIYPGTQIGNECLIHAGVSLGTDGFRFEQWPERRLIKKLIHAGGVKIGDRVEIGANSTVDRATFEGECTVVEDDVKLDDQVHVGHNAAIGQRTTIAAQSCLSGSVVLEDDVWVGAAATISQGVRVGRGAKVLINAVVVKDVEPGGVVSGFYAMQHRDWKRAYARLSRPD